MITARSAITTLSDRARTTTNTTTLMPILRRANPQPSSSMIDKVCNTHPLVSNS